VKAAVDLAETAAPAGARIAFQGAAKAQPRGVRVKEPLLANRVNGVSLVVTHVLDHLGVGEEFKFHRK
jgi:hypothetical protein